jgi:hypothetical protein
MHKVNSHGVTPVDRTSSRAYWSICSNCFCMTVEQHVGVWLVEHRFGINLHRRVIIAPPTVAIVTNGCCVMSSMWRVAVVWNDGVQQILIAYTTSRGRRSQVSDSEYVFVTNRCGDFCPIVVKTFEYDDQHRWQALNLLEFCRRHCAIAPKYRKRRFYPGSRVLTHTLSTCTHFRQKASQIACVKKLHLQRSPHCEY